MRHQLTAALAAAAFALPLTAFAQERYPEFPVAWFLKDRFESVRYAGAVRARVLVILADHDVVIPRAHADALIGRFPSPPSVVVVPNTGHNRIHESTDYAKAVADFLGPH